MDSTNVKPTYNYQYFFPKNIDKYVTIKKTNSMFVSLLISFFIIFITLYFMNSMMNMMNMMLSHMLNMNFHLSSRLMLLFQAMRLHPAILPTQTLDFPYYFPYFCPPFSFYIYHNISIFDML